MRVKFRRFEGLEGRVLGFMRNPVVRAFRVVERYAFELLGVQVYLEVHG